MACVLPGTMAGGPRLERSAGGGSGCASRHYYAFVRPAGQQKNKCIDDDTSVTPVIPFGSVGRTYRTANAPGRIDASENRPRKHIPGRGGGEGRPGSGGGNGGGGVAGRAGRDGPGGASRRRGAGRAAGGGGRPPRP